MDFNANQTLERTARGIENEDPNKKYFKNLDKSKKKVMLRRKVSLEIKSKKEEKKRLNLI